MAERVGADALRVPRQRVRRSSVRGQTLEALRGMLASGELAPGEVYSAPSLGAGLGVSATPVREAMQQLAAEGAVEVVPNVGFRVVERRAPAGEELAEVRRLLVVPVVRRLAGGAAGERGQNLDADLDLDLDLDRLRDAARAADAAPRDTAAECGFFAELFALAGNGELADVADAVLRRAQAARVGGARPGGGSGRAPYERVVDAIRAGDEDAAEAAVSVLLS
ncbi:GntR family transcriptional regulator [Streptomyces boninensis]|uniref:GntR family transcriptional regulator n=1 Tax=Streptomyces boninensis TaxID=2039455 RepID=UPI003B20C5FE